MHSHCESSNSRWSIDATTIFCGEDGWCPLTAIIDCHDRCIVGWRLSCSGISKHVAAALEEALLESHRRASLKNAFGSILLKAVMKLLESSVIG